LFYARDIATQTTMPEELFSHQSF